MEQVKEAFSKVKQDIESLKGEVASLSEGLKDTRQRLIEICDVLQIIARKNEKAERTGKEEKEEKDELPILKEKFQKENIPSEDNSLIHPIYNCPFQKGFPICLTPILNPLSTQNVPLHSLPYPQNDFIPTQVSKNPTEKEKIKTNPAHNLPYSALKDENKVVSTGNEGVPTDRQTNQQTNQQTDKGSYNIGIKSEEDSSSDYINDAAKILDSLDSIKKEVRLKFKRLTDQEFSVFSVIYQLSEEEGYTDYKNLSIKLGLTESSIRDYIGRLIKKGIPVEKTKINNKTIHLSVSSNLKKIASLPTILQLRAL